MFRRPVDSVSRFEPYYSSDFADRPLFDVDDPQTLGRVRQVGRGDLTDALARFAAAGLTVDRTTCPDLAAQLAATLTRPVDIAVCLAVDPDPEVASASAVLRRLEGMTLRGSAALARLAGAGRLVVIFDPARGTASFDAQIDQPPTRAIPTTNIYPLGDPVIAAREVLNRPLAPGRLPTSVGLLIFDPAAAVGVARVLAGESPVWLPLTLHDAARQHTHHKLIRAGTRLNELLETHAMVGTPLAGARLARRPLDRRTLLGGGELSVWVEPLSHPVAAQSCVKCGWCCEVCPVEVRPAELLEVAQGVRPVGTQAAGLDRCIECGLCSHVCPSRLPLVEAVRLLRSDGGSR